MSDQPNLSKQPRFKEPTVVWDSFYQWALKAHLQEPKYMADSRTRDEWLSEFWKLEPHLAGVINSVVAIDKSRGWTLTGGRNQVRRFTNILYNAENGEGWRHYMSVQAHSYYTTDIGAITEIGRIGRNGPTGALYHVDSTRCRLSGDPDTPLIYYPAKGGQQKWSPNDFFRVSSMPSGQEKYRGLGFCAVSRALELVKLMVAVYEHDKEALSVSPPSGFLMVNGITRDQFMEAMEERKKSRENRDVKYYRDVALLISPDGGDIDVKLQALSQLPESFDLPTFVDILMQGIALCFGYDVSEFYSVHIGGFGNSEQTEVQSQKAAGKGEKDFVGSYQFKLQQELPETLVFEFDERDDAGDRLRAEMQKLQAETFTSLYEAGLPEGSPVLGRDEVRALLAEIGVIPREWAEEGLDVEGESTDVEKERVRDHASVRRAAEVFPDDPIVRFHYPSERMTVLFPSGQDMLRRRSFPAAKVRQAEPGEAVYSKNGVLITVGDIDAAIDEARERVGDDFADLLMATTADE